MCFPSADLLSICLVCVTAAMKCGSAGECAQIAERLKKAMQQAEQDYPMQSLAFSTETAASKLPGYEGDVEK